MKCPNLQEKKNNLTISCHFDGQYSGSKIRKYPKEKNQAGLCLYPLTLKDMVAMSIKF